MLYQRAKVAGGTYFFTVNLAERNRNLLVEQVDVLRTMVQKVNRVDTKGVIACFDALCQTLTRPTGGGLDKAPQHTSPAFKAPRPEWEKAGLFLYSLPPSCPELHLIEILWRFIQYRWLPLTAYPSYPHLKEALEHRLASFGEKYHLTFA